MATKTISITGFGIIPDAAGPYFAPLSVADAGIGTAPGLEIGLVLDCDPASDLGCSGKFRMPEDYASTPVLIITGTIDGTVGTEDINTGMEVLARADNEAYDTAFETEDTATFQSDAYTDQDVFEETMALGNATLAANDMVAYHFFIDDSAGTPFTGNILVTGLFLKYTTT